MSTAEMCLFNVKDGFLEGVVRGYKLGLLTAADYNNLSQCENLEDIKLYLTGTDYAQYVSNEAGPLHTTTLVECCTRKLVDDWEYLRQNASEPLGTFLDYCTFGHMIDNIVLIVTGTLHERDVQASGGELLDKCNPLGVFDAIATLAVAQNMRDLYRLVLVDTPLAPYFSGALDEGVGYLAGSCGVHARRLTQKVSSKTLMAPSALDASIPTGYV
ncbi:putative V-type proton ATPase subunit d [Auxenochlorella protothecoides]|uniref:Putative V-type proton ATPase subunit d n=1 Tax=Auxenochlorella protothecoides TaxID=3075 RepID=A0A087SFC4_AUXPR|nr:putative V-type proton ATPase subunit d [Auxenochlorella protothecoides]KFM24428.1 putative V-type proton ATPase subunit d [Auxenochlorella protothecoides]